MALRRFFQDSRSAWVSSKKARKRARRFFCCSVPVMNSSSFARVSGRSSVAQHPAEGIEQGGLVAVREVQIVVGKSRGVAVHRASQGDLVERLAQLVGQGRVFLGHPMIEEEGVDLAAQHLRGIQVDGGRLHVAVQHLQRVREEILIVPVGGGIGDGEHRRVAVPAAGAADALDEIGLVGRNAAQHHAGQGADVDAHLQGRRRREQVLVPGLRGLLGGHEAVLQGDPLVALQQPRVLVGDDPGDVASQPDGRATSSSPRAGSGRRVSPGLFQAGSPLSASAASSGTQRAWEPDGVISRRRLRYRFSLSGTKPKTRARFPRSSSSTNRPRPACSRALSSSS